MPAISPHDTGVVDTPWDAGLHVGRLSNDAGAATYRRMYAWRDPAKDPDTKAAYKFPHHMVSSSGRVGAANLPGVRNGLARLSGSNVPAPDQEGVRRHLQRHLAAQRAEGEPPPRDTLYRGIWPGDFELRDDDGDGDGNGAGLGTMVGHFAVFDEWVEIDSIFEGRFLERIAAGAFTKTFAEQGEQIRVLFQHGRDPVVGSKPLGAPDVLSEDDFGAYYEVPLIDTSYVRDLIPGLEAGLYGASFRFRVVREELNQEPKKSKRNPEGLPERTIQEVAVREFGPVTFPAYASATAGMRSLTDEFVLQSYCAADSERLLELIEHVTAEAPSSGAGEDHSDDESREEEVNVEEAFAAMVADVQAHRNQKQRGKR